MQIKRGDTLVEVVFAIAIFALVAIISINAMNGGLSVAQQSLEITMTRNEMDAQAEALRFVHNAFALERELVVEKQQYRDLWYKLTRDSNSGIEPGMANTPDALPELTVTSCNQIYENGGGKSIIGNNDLTAFVMNTRAIDPDDKTFAPTITNEGARLDQIVVSTKVSNASSVFTETAVNPRLIFTDRQSVGLEPTENNSDAQLAEQGEFRYLAKAEGIWIIAVKDKSRSSGVTNATPEFFDFHIRSCWFGPGATAPSTIGTIVRLYNPEVVENVTIFNLGNS